MFELTRRNNGYPTNYYDPFREMEKLERGVTYWEAFGGYTGDAVRVLCVCLSKYEIETLQTVMRELDPNAFFIVQQGVQIGGNFERHLT